MLIPGLGLTLARLLSDPFQSAADLHQERKGDEDQTASHTGDLPSNFGVDAVASRQIAH
jgi:hypothetical protein